MFVVKQGGRKHKKRRGVGNCFDFGGLVRRGKGEGERGIGSTLE